MAAGHFIANYTQAVDFISFLVCCILLFIISKTLFFSTDKKFILLKRCLKLLLVASFCNIAFYSIITYWPDILIPIFIFRDFNRISILFSLFYFMQYLEYMVDLNDPVEDVIKIISKVLLLITVAMEVLSPFTKIGLYVIDGEWYRTLLSPYNIFYVYAFIGFNSMVFIHSRRIIKYVRTSLIVTLLIVAGIMIYQCIVKTETYTVFTYVLPVLTVMILLHCRPFDDKTGALGLASLDNYIKKYSNAKIGLDYAVLKLNINTQGGIPNELGKILNSFWHDYFKNALSFNLTAEIFVLAVPRQKKNGNVEEKLNKLLLEEFYIYYEQYKIPFKMIGIYGVDFIETSTNILGVTRIVFPRMEENTVLILDEEAKKKLRVMRTVREALEEIAEQNNMDDPRVLVYCQPIRNMQTGKFDTAEALMRLNLEGIGLVMPDMFITLAEEYGYINTLTKIILNKVCKLVKTLDDDRVPFKRISVNVSALDVKINGFCEDLIQIVKNHNVNSSKIGIELTESQTDKDLQLLNSKIKLLREAGMTLYLDDVGTGYSNLDRIVQYDVDVVKFDRFFLLEAEKSMKIIKMMTHLSQAFQDLEYKLLFEGVETESHEVLCMNCGADYIQGFKYSKPVPGEELRNFFNDDSLALNNEVISERRDFSYTEMKDQYSILIAMSKLFYSMHVIDLINNTAKPYNPTEDVRVVDVVNSTMGADVMMKQIMRMCTVDEHVPAVLEFTDLKTIPERMKGKKILSAEYIGKSIGWYVASFYTIEADASGRPTKLVFTTRSIDDIKKKQQNS